MILFNYSKGGYKRMEKGRRDTVLLTVIAIATLLVAIVGATFAFFTAQLNGNNRTSTITIQSSTGGGVTFYSTNVTAENAGVAPANINPSQVQGGQAVPTQAAPTQAPVQNPTQAPNVNPAPGAPAF